MPPVIAAAAGLVGTAIAASIGGSILGIAAATIGGIVGSALGSVAQLLTAGRGRRPTARDPGVPQTVRQPLPFRERVYGRVRKGGPLAHGQLIDSNRRLLLIVPISEGPVKGPTEIWFGDEKVWTSTGTFANGDVSAHGDFLEGWADWAYVEFYDGSQTAASTYFVAASRSGADDAPTSANPSEILTAPGNVSVDTAEGTIERTVGEDDTVVTEDVENTVASWTAATGGTVAAYRVSWTDAEGVRSSRVIDGALTELVLGRSWQVPTATAGVSVAARDADGDWTDAIDGDDEAEPREQIWGSDRIGTGVAYIAVDLTWDKRRKRFPNGAPNVTVVLEGARDIFDPRDDSTGYSRNAGLILRHYLADPVCGLGAPAGELSAADWSAQASLCDEDADIPGGGTEPRYRIDGIVSAEEERAGTILDLAAAQASDLIWSAGLLRPTGGAVPSPVLDITDDDIMGPISGQADLPPTETFNTIRGTFTPPETNWVPTDYPRVSRAAYVTEDGGERVRELPQPFTASAVAAQRLADVLLKQGRRKVRPVVPLGLRALQLEPGDTIRWTSARYGWGTQWFTVLGTRLALPSGEDPADPGALVVEVQLAETGADFFQWSAADAIAANLLPRARPLRVGLYPPSDVEYVIGTRQAADGTTIARTTVTWTASPDAQVTGYELRADFGGGVQIHAVTGLRWEADRPVADISVRAVAPGGLVSAWVVAQLSGDFDPADQTAPAAPPSAAVIPDNLGQLLVFPERPADVDFSHFRVYTSASAEGFVDATFRVEGSGSPLAVGSLTLAATYRVWVTAVDRTGNEGLPLDAGTAVVGAVLAGDVVFVYAADKFGNGQSFEVGEREYVRAEEYTGTTPTLPLTVPPLFVRFKGEEGTPILIVYADDDEGDGQSLTPEGKSFYTFAETRNLILDTGGINRPSWDLTGATVTANVAGVVTGNSNVDTLVEDSSTGLHQVGQAFAPVSGETYTWSAYVKGAGRTKVRLAIDHDGGSTVSDFDLSAKTATGDGRILAFGDGMLRIALSATVADGAVGTPTVRIGLLNGSGDASYAGDGTSGAHMIFQQLQRGGTVTEYRPGIPLSGQTWLPMVTVGAGLGGLRSVSASGNILAEDAMGTVLGDHASGLTLTVPAGLGWAVNQYVNIGQLGAGQITVAAGASVTISTPETAKTAKEKAMIVLTCTGGDTYWLGGYLEAS